MAMGIGINTSSKTTTIRRGNKITKRTVYKNIDGQSYSISVTKSIKKKTKKLNYNFKSVSTKILQSKTSGNARQAVSSARRTAGMLRRRLRGGEYDDKELERAIIHAEKMERIAKKKLKHLQQEEKAEQGTPILEEPEDTEEALKAYTESQSGEPETLSKEEVRKLMRELQKLMREMTESMGETEGISDTDELSEKFAEASLDNMEPEDLEMLKKKHRLAEMREIMEADMKYLKALFDDLAREKQAAASGSFSGSDNSTGAADVEGVTLELAGAEMPVELTEATVMTEGGSIDVSL